MMHMYECTDTRKGDTTSDRERSKEKPDISRRPRRDAASQAVVQSMMQQPIRSSATIARDKILYLNGARRLLALPLRM